MTPLRTTVLMKTDIAGSTPRFRELLPADLQALLSEHRSLVACTAANHGGQIAQPTGDGYWLEFPSVTAAAKSAIALQETLRLEQPNKGDDRLSVRAVIGLGDVASREGELIGDVLALIARIESITPADEIYLTEGARLALPSIEIQTSFVNDFSLKGFPEPIPVYRINQRHRTRIITDAYILISDIRGFARLIETAAVARIEHVLDTLDALTLRLAHEFGGTIRFSAGDSYCMTFLEASQAIAAAEQLSQQWPASIEFPINIALHRGNFNVFRSFLYGDGVNVALQIEKACSQELAAGEGGIFVSSTARDDLFGSHWHNRIQPVTLKRPDARLAKMQIYRLERGSSGRNG